MTPVTACDPGHTGYARRRPARSEAQRKRHQITPPVWLEFRSYEGANAGLALIRDGNATRSFDTLMRYRSAAMAEFWRALKTLKALQAEQAAEQAAGAQALEMAPQAAPCAGARSRPVPRRTNPSAGRCNEYVIPDQAGPGRTLHEPAARWMPNEPEPGRDQARSSGGVPDALILRMNGRQNTAGAQSTSSRPQLAAWSMRRATTGRLSMRMAASWG